MLQSTLALALIAGLSSLATAQPRRPEQVPRVMIPTFQSTDVQLGLQVAEALRARVQRDAGERGLYVIPRADINNALQSSGYSVTEALAPNDAKLLANLLRADEYLDGVVSRTATGVRIEARLVLSRDNTIAQVLPPAEAPRLDGAVEHVSREYRAARGQVAHEGNCAGALRAGDAPRAIRLAETGLSQNPRYNNMIRVCLANAYVQRDTPRDSASVVSAQTLALVQEVLRTDPRNIQALRLAAVGYKAARDAAEVREDTAASRQADERYVQTLTSLVAADPSDLRLQEQVVNELAASGRANLAVPIILDALEANPGDPRMLRTAWLVLLAAREYPRAIGVGEEMVRVDTGAATADYFRRLAVAHGTLAQGRLSPTATAADSQATLAARQRRLDVLQRGTARFPNDASLQVLYSQALREAGQGQAAIQAAQRALSLDPRLNDARVALVQAYAAARQTDAALAAIRDAAAAGVNRTLLSQLSLQLGNEAYRAGQASRARADHEIAVRVLRLSNELEANVDAQFLLGAAAFSLGDAMTRDAQSNRDCASARGAQEAFATARTNLMAGQSRYPEPARQLLEAIGQFTTPVSQMVRAYCR